MKSRPPPRRKRIGNLIFIRQLITILWTHALCVKRLRLLFGVSVFVFVRKMCFFIIIFVLFFILFWMVRIIWAVCLIFVFLFVSDYKETCKSIHIYLFIWERLRYERPRILKLYKLHMKQRKNLFKYSKIYNLKRYLNFKYFFLILEKTENSHTTAVFFYRKTHFPYKLLHFRITTRISAVLKVIS